MKPELFPQGEADATELMTRTYDPYYDHASAEAGCDFDAWWAKLKAWMRKWRRALHSNKNVQIITKRGGGGSREFRRLPGRTVVVVTAVAMVLALPAAR